VITALMFNYGLVCVISWIAGVVTRACTAEENFALMDEQGLLTSLTRKKTAKAKKAGRSGPRHPGWVLMWTSIVALACFAAGESIIGGASEGHRRHAVMCMVSYSFFALVLLALTSLSALRMSARQRRIRVHSSITPVWTIASATIVAIILAIAAVLPTVKAAEHVRNTISQLPSWVREAPATSLDDAPDYGVRSPDADPGGDDDAGQDEGARQGAEGNDAGEFADSGDDDSPTQGGGEGGEESATPESAGSSDEGAGESGQGASDSSEGAGGQGDAGEGGGGEGEGDPDSGEGAQSDSENSPSEGDGDSSEGEGEQESESGAASEGDGSDAEQASDAGASDSAGGMKLPPWWLWLLILLALLLLALLIAYVVWRTWKNRKN
ncbi:MAG TPA: hypothetical protein QGF05_07745, partial [Dehalococcoidia bacterium]|nr:hypothetical protein [Dehalococcoidia bacterium]